MPFIPFDGAAGSPGKLVGTYQYKIGSGGELELWKGNVKIATQDVSGTWLMDSVTTGVGSLHLGEAHSMSSAGQNVGFKNEYSKSADNDKIFFFPPWQGLPTDGATVVDPSVLKFSGLADSEPNGALHTGNLYYNFNLDATSDFAVFKLTVRPSENYTGKLTNRIISRVNSADVYDTVVSVVATVGTDLVIQYKYPFFVRNGDQLTLRLIKEDGSYLLVKNGITNQLVPWRKLSIRPFVDSKVSSAKDGGRVEQMINSDGGTATLESYGPINLVSRNTLAETAPILTVPAWVTSFEMSTTVPTVNAGSSDHGTLTWSTVKLPTAMSGTTTRTMTFRGCGRWWLYRLPASPDIWYVCNQQNGNVCISSPTMLNTIFSAAEDVRSWATSSTTMSGYNIVYEDEVVTVSIIVSSSSVAPSVGIKWKPTGSYKNFRYYGGAPWATSLLGRQQDGSLGGCFILPFNSNSNSVATYASETLAAAAGSGITGSHRVGTNNKIEWMVYSIYGPTYKIEAIPIYYVSATPFLETIVSVKRLSDAQQSGSLQS